MQSQLSRRAAHHGGGIAHLNKPDRQIVARGSEIIIHGHLKPQVIDIGTPIIDIATSPPNYIITITAQGLIVLDATSHDLI
jgi:hypothetical protein